MATTWICGATGAIGSALARRLYGRGERLVLTARSEHELHELARSLGPNALALPGDLTDAGAAPQLLEAAQARIGAVTGLAHCIGSILIKPLHLTSDAELNAVFAQNTLSAAYVLRAFVQAALKHKEPASAVLVGSVAASVGLPNHEAIAAAKAAVAALAVSAAATYVERGIRVNCVHPSLTQSAMSSRYTGTDVLREKMGQLNPMGRIGRGDDSAALIAFLLSDDASWITGQQIGVDGGHATLQRVRA